MANKVYHKADTKGFAYHGWLQSYHTFSFAEYSNPERVNFGMLRVLNDDTVEAGKGFGLHPHDNMEIISIPLEGDLEHRDSMGNVTVIWHGDITVYGNVLNTRDGLGIWDTDKISIIANSPDAEVLLMELPMK